MRDLSGTSRSGNGRRRCGGRVLFALPLVLALGCAGSEPASLATDPVSTSEPAVTSAPTTLTTPTTTSSTTTTTTTTTEPRPVVDTVPSTDETTPAPVTEPPASGDAAPTNTTFDPSTPAGEAEQAALADLAAFVTCLEQLPNCDVDAALQHSLFGYADANAVLLAEWNAAGYEARGTEDFNYRVDGIEMSEDGTEAIATVCLWGGTQLYLPATNTAPEEIIDGEYESSLDRYLVRRIGDDWFVTAAESTREATGESSNLCV